MFRLDTFFHILSFSCKGVNLSWGISHRITDMKVILFEKDGYVEFMTNIGVEGLDILDDDSPKSVKNAVLSYLESVESLEVEIL